jgi:hypothetical protein
MCYRYLTANPPVGIKVKETVLALTMGGETSVDGDVNCSSNASDSGVV